VHGEQVLSLRRLDPEQQIALAQEIIEKGLTMLELGTRSERSSERSKSGD